MIPVNFDYDPELIPLRDDIFWTVAYCDSRAETGFFYITKDGGFGKNFFSKDCEYVITSGSVKALTEPPKVFKYGGDIESTPFYEEVSHSILDKRMIVMSTKDIIDLGCNIAGDSVLLIKCTTRKGEN